MLKNNEELSFPFFFLFLGMSSWCCVNPCWFCESEFDFMGGVLLYRWWWKYLEDVNSFFYINSNKFYHHCSCLGIPFGLFASLKLMNVLPLYRVKNVLLFSSHNGSHDTCTHISPTHCDPFAENKGSSVKIERNISDLLYYSWRMVRDNL